MADVPPILPLVGLNLQGRTVGVVFGFDGENHTLSVGVSFYGRTLTYGFEMQTEEIVVEGVVRQVPTALQKLAEFADHHNLDFQSLVVAAVHAAKEEHLVH